MRSYIASCLGAFILLTTNGQNATGAEPFDLNTCQEGKKIAFSKEFRNAIVFTTSIDSKEQLLGGTSFRVGKDVFLSVAHVAPSGSGMLLEINREIRIYPFRVW